VGNTGRETSTPLTGFSFEFPLCPKFDGRSIALHLSAEDGRHRWDAVRVLAYYRLPVISQQKRSSREMPGPVKCNSQAYIWISPPEHSRSIARGCFLTRREGEEFTSRSGFPHHSSACSTFLVAETP
jgi:hypothetical protein